MRQTAMNSRSSTPLPASANACLSHFWRTAYATRKKPQIVPVQVELVLLELVLLAVVLLALALLAVVLLALALQALVQ